MEPKLLVGKCLRKVEIPLHTFRADIDYARDEAIQPRDVLELKYGLCRGEIYGRPDLFASTLPARQQHTPVSGTGRPRSRGKRK